MRADLDHVAIGAWSMEDVAADFTSSLGGREIARFSIASWAGLQLAFAGGIRLEVLEPIENPADDFLERFLQRSGVGPHHATFKVEDIQAALARLKELGVEPVKVDLSNEQWREAFLHPALGLGTVVQLAQQGGKWESEREPDPEREGATRAEFLGAEMACDLQVAATVFGDVLGGAASQVGDAIAYSWSGGGTLVANPVADGDKPRVLALVFRQAGDAGNEIEAGEQQLYGGPATIVRLGPHEVWPR
ncbi:MAG TPA: VOC family protein [Candidatus Dormibacteraeota bacterium]|nr:VOC family protein [Candidatus Dormibacteraeota bacterium]